MGGNDPEVQALKDDVSEIKETVKNVETAVNSLHLLIVGKYMTKDDLNDFKAEHEKVHDKLKEENDSVHSELKTAVKGLVPGWIAIVLPILTAIISGLAVHTLGR
ncbi:hypothetical protein [Desulfitobacterium sp.]|uniref:hypothetical protein n=1 Tax=Desulfitobacterium sp. TaxID=49981 RepID=UPI002C19B1CA|nr:hypothetical protein [Desulfitobacterium sp.]HVJ48020.1 hypothetical protein [Desulfitobacterium sp.]